MDGIVQFLPVYVLVFFRVAGMMVFAPLLGSVRVPRRVKGMIAVVLAVGLAPTVPPPANIPSEPWLLAVGIGGELMFGLAMGTVLSLTFIAAQWAGEMIGQQMGMNLGESFDPSFGSQGSFVGDLYFMLTLVVFLAVRGHHAMLIGVRNSFDTLPLLTVGINGPVLDLMVHLLQTCTMLAFQLAAPVLVTMLVVDLAMGFISKTMPQINVMSAGITVRGVISMVVLVLGISLTSDVLRTSLLDAMRTVIDAWSAKT